MNVLKVFRNKLCLLYKYDYLNYIIAQRTFAINSKRIFLASSQQGYLTKFNRNSNISRYHFSDKPDKTSSKLPPNNKDDDKSSKDYKPESDKELQEFLAALHKDFKFEKGDGLSNDLPNQNVNQTNTKPKDSSDSDMRLSLKEKFKTYDDDDFEVILSHEEQEYFYSQKYEDAQEPEFTIYKEKKSIDHFNQKRGVEGVFDVADFVEVLKSEKVADVAVISVPPEMAYCHYLVIGTGASPRHMNATMELIVKLYKARKHRKDPFVAVNGEKCLDWKVLDMGNIVFHLFLKKTRKVYDLETLWTVGPEYDSCLHAKDEEDALSDFLEPHLKYLNEAVPLESETVTQAQPK